MASVDLRQKSRCTRAYMQYRQCSASYSACIEDTYKLCVCSNYI